MQSDAHADDVALATIDAALTEIIARDARARLVERMRRLTPEQRDAILHSWD